MAEMELILEGRPVGAHVGIDNIVRHQTGIKKAVEAIIFRAYVGMIGRTGGG